jgi:hypothetical protein
MELRFLKYVLLKKIIKLVVWVTKIHKSVRLWQLEKIVHGHRRLWGESRRSSCLKTLQSCLRLSVLFFVFLLLNSWLAIWIRVQCTSSIN